MNPTRPTSKSFRTIGCLMLLVYVLALPGIAPYALAGLTAAGDHEHDIRFTADRGHMSMVLHHHEIADEQASDAHDSDKEPVPRDELLAADAGHAHGDHVIDLSSGSAAAVAAMAKSGKLPAPNLAPSWEAAQFAPVWPRELKCAPPWGHPPPGGTARMTCLRTTVLVI